MPLAQITWHIKTSIYSINSTPNKPLMLWLTAWERLCIIALIHSSNTIIAAANWNLGDSLGNLRISGGLHGKKIWFIFERLSGDCRATVLLLFSLIIHVHPLQLFYTVFCWIDHPLFLVNHGLYHPFHHNQWCFIFLPNSFLCHLPIHC